MTQPMNPADYVASPQVNIIIEMIIESRPRENSSWNSKGEKRFHDGARWQLNVIMRALVELETKITNPEDLDELCSDLITEALINKC